MAIDRCASCKFRLTGAMGTVFVLERQDRLALQSWIDRTGLLYDRGLIDGSLYDID